eukprot:s8659_g1.t1
MAKYRARCDGERGGLTQFQLNVLLCVFVLSGHVTDVAVAYLSAAHAQRRRQQTEVLDPRQFVEERSQHFVDMWRGFVSRAVEAGAGIWLHREDSHILWPDGVRASILKRGSQFLLPYERELPPGSTNRVAPVAAGPPDPGPDLGHYEYIPEHDLEAREVEDAAMQAAADQEEG